MSRRAFLITLALAAALLSVAQWTVLRSRRTHGDESGGLGKAQWIWAEQRGEPGTPMAFFAVKDFDLDFDPFRAAITITADEEYHLGINSPGFGVGAMSDDARLDRYLVQDILRRGSNRIRVELRSSRGVGGFLARLEVSDGWGRKVDVVTDDSWRIFRTFDPEGLGESDEIPVVWGRPPTGRWGERREVRDALSLTQLQGETSRRPLPAQRWRLPREEWRKAETYLAPRIDRWVTFDFGASQTGFLNVKFDDREPSLGFVFYGARAPKDGLERPDEVIVRMRGRDHWPASRPARFRFVTVVGSPTIVGVEIFPVAAELAADRLDGEPVVGLFGIEQPQTLLSPVEHEVRRQLEGLPGLAGR